jgi:Carboxypeptidase regulatory-like domain
MRKTITLFLASPFRTGVLAIRTVWERAPARLRSAWGDKTRSAGRVFIVCAILPLPCSPLYGQVATASITANASAKPETQELDGNSQHPQNQPPQRNDRGDSSSSPQEKNAGPQLGSIVGTVTDVKGDPVRDATVVLRGTLLTDQRTVGTNDNGFFEIHDVGPGISYHVTVIAAGFADWTSSDVTLSPGQYEILTGIELRIEELRTTVTVSPQTSEEIAAEQVEAEEMQRGFGIIPNFLEVYNPDAEPLTWRLKFSLAFKVARDPITFTGAGLLAGESQVVGTPRYADGTKGFVERFGASYANQFTDTMIGDAILPSLLHQDPRYFYQGTGTKKSRALHAISNLFMTRGDNGHLQPNYSIVGGDLASAAISTVYYPGSSRSAGLVFQNFAINLAVHMSGRLLQEFVFHPSRRCPQQQDPSVP